MKDGKVGAKMSLVEVAPITRSAHTGETLTYFTSARVSPGQVVRIAIRKSRVPGIVTAVRSARSAKQSIRTAGYALKKIGGKDILNASLSPSFLQAARKTAGFYAVPLGTVLSSLLPKLVLENSELTLLPKPKRKKKEEPVIRETLLVQMEDEERFSHYRSVIRQSFARRTSVLFIAPTKREVELAYATLSRGIESYAYLVTGSQKEEEAGKAWNEALRSEHSVLFVTTPFGIGFERPDLETIVLERENSLAYRMLKRPFLNIATFAEMLAQESKKELVLGDSVLSLGSLWREKQGKASELSPLKWRLMASPASLVDMRTKGKNISQEEKGGFEVFSAELASLIRKSLDERSGILLFAVRKGLAPTTACRDCGTLLSCKHCHTTLVLHRKQPDNIYVCHKCGETRESHTRCDECHSWNLATLGIGTGLIKEEAGRMFPDAKVHVLDKDHAPTPARARKIAKSFREEGGILVGTEMALSHLDRVPYVGVVSLDSLFSLPDYSADERLFYLVSRLREASRKETLVQTRKPGKEVLAWAVQGNIVDFYKTSIEERQSLFYPPFSLFIKVTSKDISKLKPMFAPWNPVYTRDSMIIRISRDQWPDAGLARALSLLTTGFLIKVDPESIL